MKVELYCFNSFSDAEGTRFTEKETYSAEIIHDILIIKADNHISVAIMDFKHNEWFVNYLQFKNVIPLPVFQNQQQTPKVKIG